MESDFAAEDRALKNGWRWKCCPCCPRDWEFGRHPDPLDQHKVPCEDHAQDHRHGRTRAKGI